MRRRALLCSFAGALVAPIPVLSACSQQNSEVVLPFDRAQISRGSLSASHTLVSAFTIERALNHPATPFIQTVRLVNTGADESVITVLTHHEKTQHLKLLSLGNNPIGDPTIARLLSWSGARSLSQMLSLANTQLGAQSIRALTASPFSCPSLDLSKNSLQGLTASLAAINVNTLICQSCSLDSADAAGLIENTTAQILHLDHNNLLGLNLTSVSPNLRSLSLLNSQISDQTLLSLCRCEALLTSLSLADPFSTTALKALLGAPWLPHLQMLVVKNTGQPRAALIRLKEQLRTKTQAKVQLS